MKSEKVYLIGRLGGYGAATALLAAILGGCSSGKKVCAINPTNYKVPQAHVEMHKRMLATQHQLIIPHKNDESTDD